VSPTRSREFERTRSCGSLVCVTRCGLDGSVTSTTEKLIGAHSWAMYMMRRPSRVFCSPIPSPPLPKPPRSLWPIKRMFLLSVPLAIVGALIDVSSVLGVAYMFLCGHPTLFSSASETVQSGHCSCHWCRHRRDQRHAGGS